MMSETSRQHQAEHRSESSSQYHRSRSRNEVHQREYDKKNNWRWRYRENNSNRFNYKFKKILTSPSLFAPAPESNTWTCDECNYINNNYTHCILCASPKPDANILESASKDKIKNMKSEIGILKRQLSLEKSSNLDTIKDLKADIERKDKHIRNLELDHDTISDLKVKLELKDTKISDLNDKIFEDQDTISSLDDKISDQAEKLTYLERKLELEKSLRDESNATLNIKKRDLDFSQGTVDDLKVKIKLKDEIIKNLLSKIHDKDIEHQETILNLNSKVESLTTIVENKEAEKEKFLYQNKIAILNRNIKNLTEEAKKEKSALQSEIAKIKCEKLDLQKRSFASIDSWRLKYTECDSISNKKIADLNNTIINLTNEKENIEKDLETSKQENSKIYHLINEANTNVETHVEKNRQLEQKVTDLIVLNETKNKEKKEIEVVINEKQMIIDRIKKSKEDGAATVQELEKKIKIIQEENECLKKDSLQDKSKVETDIEKLKSSLESSNQLLSEQTAQIVLLEDEVNLNNSCLNKVEELRLNLEIVRKDLVKEKEKNVVYEMQNRDETIDEYKMDINTYKKKVQILEKKIETIQTISKLQLNPACESAQSLVEELENNKQLLTKEREKTESSYAEKKELTSRLEEIMSQMNSLEKKAEEQSHFEKDTIANLKNKIKLKDEEIRLLTDKVEKELPQRMANLSYQLNLKREILATQCDNSESNENIEGISSFTSNPLNQYEFFKLNEKLAESEDYTKSLTTILEAKEEENAKLQSRIKSYEEAFNYNTTSKSGKDTQVRDSHTNDSVSLPLKEKPAEKRTHENTRTQDHEIKKKRLS